MKTRGAAHTLITEEIIRVSGTLCQELGEHTDSILTPLVCDLIHLKVAFVYM